MFLASSSPRRQHLLRQAGLPFRLVEPGAEPEDLEFGPRTSAALKARAKAQGAQTGQRSPAHPVLGVDTMVVLDSAVFGKPRDRQQARETLTTLAGRTHEVLTAHWLELPAPTSPGASGPRTSLGFAECVVARVAFAPFTDAEPLYESWLAGEGWRDKAGGYGLQEPQCAFASLATGAMDTVVGIHLPAVKRLLDAANRLGP